MTATSNVTGHDYTHYSSSYNNRGNATQKTQWLNSGGSSPVTKYTYDDTGQLLSKTDPCGNTTCSDMPSGASFVTQYSYADSYASGSPPAAPGATCPGNIASTAASA